MRILPATSLVTAILALSTSARAAPSEGELLFREGRAAMTAKDYEKACLKFAESQKKEPAPGTSLNLGDCEEQRGHLVAAQEAFTVAAQGFTAADKRKYAQSRADGIDKRIPRLTVRSSAKTPGLVVTTASTKLLVDVETKLDPGDIALHAEAPQRKPKDLKATLREGMHLDVDIGALEEVKLATVPSAPLPVAPKPDRKRDLYRTLSFVGGGLGAASLVVGGVTGVLSLGKASTVKDHCDDALACDQEGVDAAASGKTLSTVSTVTLIAGGALVAGSAALWYFGWRRPRATLLPTASRDAAGLLLSGTF